MNPASAVVHALSLVFEFLSPFLHDRMLHLVNEEAISGSQTTENLFIEYKYKECEWTVGAVCGLGFFHE
jgi:hypothetical protein